MAGDWDWVKIAAQGGFSMLTGAVGLFTGIWHAGKRSGKQEAALEEKIQQATEDRLEKAMADMRAMVAEVSEGHELLVSQFQEAFNGLRRQMDESKLATEQNFVRKDDFQRFRDEYRQDQKAIHEKLDKILLGRQ